MRTSWSIDCSVSMSIPRALAMLETSKPNCINKSMKSISSSVNGFLSLGQEKLHCGHAQLSIRWCLHKRFEFFPRERLPLFPVTQTKRNLYQSTKAKRRFITSDGVSMERPECISPRVGVPRRPKKINTGWRQSEKESCSVWTSSLVPPGRLLRDSLAPDGRRPDGWV